MTEFPKTLAAAEQTDNGLWAIADALMEEVGGAGQHGVNTGTSRAFEQVADYLALHGYAYMPDTLRRMRRVAEDWPPETRQPMSFFNHRQLKSPKLLAEYRETVGEPDALPTNRQIKLFLRQRDGVGWRESDGRTDWDKFLDATSRARQEAQLALALVESGRLPKGSFVNGPAETVVEAWEKVAVAYRELLRL